MALKSKSPSQTQTWHFITTLPLDECIRRLKTWDEPNVSATVATPENAPTTFSIEYQQPFKQRMYATGTLQRWEGTYTRVDMQLTLGTNVNSILFSAPKLILVVAVGIVIFMCQFFVNASIDFQRQYNVMGIHSSAPNPLMAGGIICVLIVAVVWAFIWWMATPDEAGQTDLTKLRNLLRNHLCKGDSSSLQYLVREGQVENLNFGK